MTSDHLITPAEYLARLRMLIGSGDDLAALAYSSRVWSLVAGQLTAHELDVASGLLEGAESAVALAEWEAAQGQDSGAPRASSSDPATSPLNVPRHRA